MTVCRSYDTSKKKELVYNYVTALDLLEFNKFKKSLNLTTGSIVGNQWDL